MTLTAQQLRVKVLAALDREGGRVEHSDGRCTMVLQQILDYPGDTLGFHLANLARDDLIRREIVGKRCFAIEITPKGVAVLRSTPDVDELFATAPSRARARKPERVPSPPEPRRPTMPQPDTPPLIAGGKRAPSIDFTFEEPPMPPAKPKPLQLHEALADGFELMRADGNEGQWARLARFPSKGGATAAAKRLAGVDGLDGFTFRAVRDGDTSLLYGVYGEQG